MDPNNTPGSSFHTDQGRWDRKDFEQDEFSGQLNDNEIRESFLGHSPSEFDEGLALNYHEDSFFEDSGHIMTDQQLEKAVKELLHNSKTVDSSDITVTANNCDITLSGTVKSQRERDSAVDLVKLIHGIGGIKNNLVVKLNEGILPSDIGRNPH